MSARVLAAALGYAALGVAVFPATSAVKKSLKCAAYSNGERWGATRDLREIRRDFTRWDGCRIGLPTGFINRIVVIDVDTIAGHGVDGPTSLQKLEAKYERLPLTRQAISPSESIHRYFRHPGPDIKIRNSASELGEGIDVRGDGGMVIAPPSVNADGRAYRWLNREPLAAMPPWLTKLTREQPRPAATISQRAVAGIRRPFNGSNGYGQAALRNELANIHQAEPGRRNAVLNKAGFSLGQLVAGGELDEAEVARFLFEAAAAWGNPNKDRDVIRSAMHAGMRHPRSRPAERS